MKNIICLMILFLFIQAPAHSQWVKMDSLSNVVWSFASSGKHLYCCTLSNGVYCSVDSGASWTPCNNGLTSLSVRSMATKDSILVIGTYGGVFKSTNYGQSWVPANYGIYFPDIRYVTFRGDSIVVGSFGGGVYVSLDQGNSFYTTNYGMTDHYVNSTFFNDTRMFCGGEGGGGIFVSNDFGISWGPKNYGVPRNPWVPSKYETILSFTSNGQSIFASTWDGQMLKSDDNGESWTSTNVGLSGVDDYINSVISCNGVLFAACYGPGVYRSLDNGMSWLATNDSLTDWGAQAVFVFGNYLFTGTINGYVFRRNLNEVVTGVDYVKSISTSTVFPNPVTGESKLTIPGYHEGSYILFVFSADGKLIKEIKQTETNYFSLFKSDFANGMYCFSLKQNGVQVSTGKFVVL